MIDRITGMDQDKTRKATTFVVLLGVISLFSDMTYESARSINGQYLNVLGVTGATVGWVAGLGELLGYGLRIVSGYLADRTQKYWLISITGYLLNLLSVPLLALAGYWQLAVLLMILERVGKAIRTPSRDAMLSFGASTMGQGWGYGLHEALDQTGATIGPLLLSAALFWRNNSYTEAYSLLAIPAVIALVILFKARFLYPHPSDLEIKSTRLSTTGFTTLFWMYILSTAFIALGFADFPLMAFHFKSKGLVSDEMIPILYSIAMAADGLVALLMGRLFDRVGILVLILASLVSIGFAPLVFAGGFAAILTGVVLWGIGMGAQESVMKAVIAEILPVQDRGKGFGVFNTAFGIFWFVGSLIMGRLYDVSIHDLIIFSVVAQMIAVLLLFTFINNKKIQNEHYKVTCT